jgi:thioredoxin-like negative regulator of GroEL
MLREESAPERLTEIAQAVLAACADGGGAGRGSPSLTALSFASAAARANGDAAQARRLLDQALAAASEPYERVDLAEHLSAAGRDADAAELLEARLREEPGDHIAAERYGALLERRRPGGGPG